MCSFAKNHQLFWSKFVVIKKFNDYYNSVVFSAKNGSTLYVFFLRNKCHKCQRINFACSQGNVSKTSEKLDMENFIVKVTVGAAPVFRRLLCRSFSLCVLSVIVFVNQRFSPQPQCILVMVDMIYCSWRWTVDMYRVTWRSWKACL